VKLCPHIFDGSEQAARWAQYAPAVKLVGGYDRAAAWKAGNAARLVWARVVPGADDLWRHVPANSFYEAHIRPHVIHPANAAVDAWESGLNEDYRKGAGETPDYADLRARAQYEAVIAALIRADGRAPVLGQFSVGTPSGTAAEQRDAWRAYGQALRAAHSYGGYISLHAYGNVAGWTGPLDALVAVLAELRLDVPILIGECGHEPGWRTWRTPEQAAGDLTAYDQALARYPAVRAAAVFASGNTPDRWMEYNVDDPVIADALTAYGQAAPPLPPPPPPERPRFSFPGAGLRMALYEAPAGRLVRVLGANWPVDVYETRGQWWRVTTAPSNYWVRMSFA